MSMSEEERRYIESRRKEQKEEQIQKDKEVVLIFCLVVGFCFMFLIVWSRGSSGGEYQYTPSYADQGDYPF